MKKVFWIVVVALLIWVIYYYYFKPRYKIYELPLNPDTNVWGAKYWKAFHSIANRIPCSSCHDEAVSFVSFWHDVVNTKLGKKRYDEANFKQWTDKICEINVSEESTETGEVERKFY